MDGPSKSNLAAGIHQGKNDSLHNTIVLFFHHLQSYITCPGVLTWRFIRLRKVPSVVWIYPVHPSFIWISGHLNMPSSVSAGHVFIKTWWCRPATGFLPSIGIIQNAEWEHSGTKKDIQKCFLSFFFFFCSIMPDLSSRGCLESHTDKHIHCECD